MTEADIIRGPWYPALKIGDEILWDLTDFDKCDSHELLTSNHLLEPTEKDNNHVSFCRGDFNVKALIYEKAISKDLLSAWTVTKDELKLDRLVRLFVRDSLYNLYLTKNLHEEPDILLALRLAYWYYRCRRLTESFIYKENEVRHKLTKGLLKQRERINRQLSADVDENLSLNNLVSDWETILLQSRISNNALRDRADIYRQQFFKDIWNVTSELLLAGVCGDNDFDITFVQGSNKSDNHDFDFIVDWYPVQVKSLNTAESVGSMASTKQRRKDYVDSGRITYDLVKRMVLEAIRNKTSEVDDALGQGAKIIFMNGTSDVSGAFFSQFCLEADNPFPFKRSLKASIDLIQAGDSFFPLIYCSTGIRLKYLINTIPLRVPLLTIDGQKKVDRSKEIGVIDIGGPYA